MGTWGGSQFFNVHVHLLHYIASLLLSILLILPLQHIAIVHDDICETDFASDPDSCLVVLDLLDEGFAADVRVTWLRFEQVIWRLRAIHFGDLPLDELLRLSQLPLNFFLHLVLLCYLFRAQLRLYFEKLIDD